MLVKVVLLYAVLLVIIYAYFGYSVLLYILSEFFKKPIKKGVLNSSVSLIITAYNEEKGIVAKLENTLKLEYPKDKLEIIVASDASSDKTDQLVLGFANKGIKLFRVEGRVGKTEVQNQAAKIAKGEIIIFSDATTRYETDLIEKMIKNFSDPLIGGVAGNLVYIESNQKQVAVGGGLYWKYEKFLRQKESDICSVIGVSGCCYAIRKSLYQPMPADIISDFIIAQLIYMKGYRVVHEPEAICYEFSNKEAKTDLIMRIRVAVRTLHGIMSMKKILNPLKYGFFSLQIISHKILRYLVPILLLFAFSLNFLIILGDTGGVFLVLFSMQLIFYFLAFLGKFKIFSNFKILKILNYFTSSNIALMLGIIQYVKGERYIVWSTGRYEHEEK